MTALAVLKYQDIITSDEINDRIAELDPDGDGRPEGLDDNEREEFAILTAFAAEAADYFPDWQYGESVIRDSYFESYAEEFADDIGAINSDLSWPLAHIDWEAAARDLQQDYTSIELDGITYWGR